AFGMLVAPVRKQAARSVLLTDPADAALDAVFRDLEAEALAAMAEEAIEANDVVLERTVAARYAGQSHELDVPAADWRSRFHDTHERRFGHARPGSPVEAVTLQVEATAPAPAIPAPALEDAVGPAPEDG